MNPITKDVVRVALALGVLAVAVSPQQQERLPRQQERLPQQERLDSERAGPRRPAGSVCRQAHGLSWQKGELRGLGGDYRVAFDGGGAVFTPALGRRAPRTYPLRLQLVSIRRGADEVVAVAPGVRPRLDGRGAVYDREAGVTERFEVRPEGVALSYEFARPIAGSGDLVVRLAVHTDLAVPRGEGAAGLTLAAEGIGGVHIGGVTGIAADGARAPGTLRGDGRGVELVLPADFVEDARYPLVLDPIIGATFEVGNPSQDDVNADVAFDFSNGVYLVVWQREFSGGDVDIRAQRVDAAGALSGNAVEVTDLTAGVAINPTVASVNATDRFLVCWQEGPSVFGPWDVAGACVDAAGGAATAPTTFAKLPGNELDPAAAS